MNWVSELCRLAESGEDAVLVTIASVRGSAPREVGARMLVTATEVMGSIGGGQLEYQCTQLACRMLEDESVECSHRRFPLGASLGQCCGGIVDVRFEFNILKFTFSN